MRRGVFWLSVLSLVLMMNVVGVLRSSAQEASPAVAECVAPELPPGTPTPMEASPVAGEGGDEEGEEAPFLPTPENGSPADDATSEAVIAAVENAVACINGGDFLGVAALVTQDFIENFIEVESVYDVPASFEGVGQTEIIRTDNVQTYEDGSVSVDFVYSGFFSSPDALTPERWFFVQEDGIYKLSNIGPIDLPADVLPGATIVEVVMVDFAFHVEPKTIPAGQPVIFQVTNQMASTTGHVAVLLTYPDGTTAEQLITGEVSVMDASTGFFGAVYLEPGQTGSIGLMGLEAGTYFLGCDVETESGHAHYVLGMVSQITVE